MVRYVDSTEYPAGHARLGYRGDPVPLLRSRW